ncbi:MAG: polyribonucleotide nucleotidyltransferase [Deltaproteobacteria bacterium]|nr:polyribonucleotide nucleotidyltransferase [Deltaproteobacteria bacterium]
MNPTEKSVNLGTHTLTFQTGKLAKQSSGAVWVTAGDTAVLVTVNAAKDPRPGVDFLPLTVDYQEKMSSAGRIPGGYFKRETRPRDDETLIARLIDRSIRPLFLEGWGYETQCIATVFSADANHPPDTLAMCGASLAVCLSDIPFPGPVAGVRVCRVDGQLVINPSVEQRTKADLNVFASCTRDAIVMVEGGGQFISEPVMIDALLFAHEQAQKVLDAMEALIKEAGKAKRTFTPKAKDAGLEAKVREVAQSKLKAAYAIKEKIPRYAALDEVKRAVHQVLIGDNAEMLAKKGEIDGFISDLKYNLVREMIVDTKKRIDGRGTADIRPITCETGVLPRTHGSALFTRGETQALVNITLGTRQDEQRIESLFAGDTFQKFMLHYNFPPYSVGEVKPQRGPGRREVGHGALAKRTLEQVMQLSEDFPYTVRVMSDILESNGSSSMATVCGGSLALMDAGVPMKAPVAGIAMGLIKEGEKIAILSDILGDEDHLGDMDFKVAGSKDGICAIQMDIKISGVSRQILETALEQARVGRLHILGEMAKCLEASRAELSKHAPRITSLRIKVDRIRDVIGPGGKVIKDIVARTGCIINVEDDGLVSVASSDSEAAERAIRMIKDLTQEAEIGKLYLGNVRKITDFGAFVEIFPGTDGLVHISELAPKRVKRVEDVLQEGDEVLVKVIGMQDGKIKLSRKQALTEEQKDGGSTENAGGVQ